MHIGKALIASLFVALIPTMGFLSSPEDGDSAEANACNAKVLEVIVKGRENRFGLDGQQVALNASIPIDRICQRVVASCSQTCATAKAEAVATGVTGFQDSDPVRLRQMGELADNFNAALGNNTSFSELGADSGAPLQCNAKVVEVIVKGRENRFGLDGQQVALNFAIPAERVCNQLSGACKQLCQTARAAGIATGVTGFQDSDPARLRRMGEVADDFNLALGKVTNFKNIAGTQPPAGGGGGGGGGGAVQCNAKLLQVIVKGREHRFGFDNRQVALNVAIPLQNICQQVNASCTATCNTAKAAAEATGIRGFTGNLDAAKLRDMGRLADTFNRAVGNTSNFEANAIFQP